MNRWCEWPLAGLLGTALLTGSLSGCGGSVEGTPTAPEAIKVMIGRPTAKEVTDYQDFTGRIEAVASVEIRARVAGYLKKIDFDPAIDRGAEVKEGDLLFEIDERPFKIALQNADAQLLQAQAKLKTSTAELERVQRLIDRDAATQSDLDRTTGSKLLAEAEIQSANAAIDQAKLDLEFSKITSPLTGRISRNLVSVGDLITASTGKLTTVVSVDPVYVYFDMDESTLQRIQTAMREGKLKGPMEGEIPVLMGLGSEEGYPYRGRLDFIENQVDPNTGTIRVRGVFANPKTERGPRPLAPGYFARVRLPLGEPHPAVLVPERAIGRDLGQPFVYVVDGENRVVFRKVTLGSLQDGLRVLTEGLSGGEQIIVNGLQRVRAGVKVADATPAGNPAAPPAETPAAAPESKPAAESAKPST
ncbi:efflux RND transporter periplasmic adaptor subunit [Planctomyces sp. SH-PL14]|uniref:efflux RND transporter periplasmic adaptor subunit n=1 Tax=Planctomyces sp. SH-PL14 TaxID=1632864 RepID=UPI00078B80B2|nr:efflux RND transporter periplasmic adaptor subunit [Planctomyces sp. SH-PL14]AMV18312.1 Efflux pump periplasmic linker BepF [Planctomyces sp. SH-PL14]